MSSVPRPTFGPKGFIAPNETAILAGVQTDINAAFGGALNSSLETPQGQLASSITALIGYVNDTFVYYTNQVDPAYATGRMQDGIARIYFLERIPSAPTVVQATCSGLTGVNIPVGALARGADGNVYSCTGSGAIGIDGTVVLSFSCTVDGPITCPAGTLDSIYLTIPGWDSINNANDGVLGQDVETRAAFEARRFASVAKNAMGFLPAVLGAVLNVDDVIDAYVTENFTSSAKMIGGYTLAANSLYVAAVGGLDADVANAIWSKKAPGCDMNGNTTVPVPDTNYDTPYPTYDITFERPIPLRVLFNVSLADNPIIPADGADQIRAAIVAAFAGEDGGQRVRIGSTIYASRFYAPVAILGSWVQIIAIDVGSTNTPSASISGSITDTTLSVTALSAGVLADGQFLSGSAGGTGVVPGTYIVQQLTGSAGGTGTYEVSISQIVPAGTIVAAVATLNDVTTRIDQSPTVSELDIVVGVT